MVEVSGNVRRPGKYEWKPGLTVGALVPDEKFFLPDTFLDYALITRLVGPERRKEILPVNLRKIVVERDAASDVAAAADGHPDGVQQVRLPGEDDRHGERRGAETRRLRDPPRHPGVRPGQAGRGPDPGRLPGGGGAFPADRGPPEHDHHQDQPPAGPGGRRVAEPGDPGPGPPDGPADARPPGDSATSP